MTGRRRVARLAGLLILWQAVTLLERVSYAAGLADGQDDLTEDDLDDLEAADVSDVVLAHVVTFHGTQAARAGECAC